MSRSLRLLGLLVASWSLGCPKRADDGPSPAASASAASAASADFRLSSAPTPGHAANAILLAPNGQAFVQILGADFPDRVRADQPFVVRTYLKVLGPVDGDGSMDLRLTNLEAKALFNAGHPPMSGAYPTSRWKAGELLVDTMEITHLKTAGTQHLSIAIDMKAVSLKLKDPPAGASWREKFEVPLGTLVVE